MKEKEKYSTLFADCYEDVFLELLKKRPRPVTYKKTLEDFFYIGSNSSDKVTYYRYLWQLNDHYIFCRKSENDPEIAFMNIQYAFMKLTSGTSINGVDHFGIKFIKRKTYEEIFHTDQEVIRKWYNFLKRFCIITKFKQDYETKNVLGEGNFAKVYCVQSKYSGNEFAVKVFPKSSIMPDSIEVKCLQYEIKMMREMDHYRVVKLHELYEGENYIYCVLEYYKGSDLFKAIIKKGFQPEAKALTIIHQILEALEYMHEKKIMHRDLKPENIMFRGSDDTIDIGIVDLGFATFEADFKKLFKRCGTPGYVAPEILEDKDYDCKVDVYSAGIIFYIILTGMIPFNGASYDEIVKKNMKANINFDFSKQSITVKDESLLKSSRFAKENARKRCEGQNFFEGCTETPCLLFTDV